MPTLAYNTATFHAGLLNSRVLIGRRISHGLVLSDPSVSRLHAWIDPTNDANAQWMIADAGSKTGTFVNDQQITRQSLQDGDVIRIGKVTLTYHDSDELPAGATPVEWSAPDGPVFGEGILFQCACGAPMWVGSELAGKRGICRHCRKPVTVPTLQALVSAPMVAPEIDPVPTAAPIAAATPVVIAAPDSAPMPEPVVAAPPEPVVIAASELVSEPDPASIVEPMVTAEAERVVIDAPAVEEIPETVSEVAQPPIEKPVDKPATTIQPSAKAGAKCAVCHSTIAEGEEITQCPDCAMTYHAECWQENLGCSSYGCPQVEVLKPREAPVVSTAPALAETPATESDESSGTPWDVVLLAASVVGSMVGALAFGVIAAIVGVTSLIFLIRGKQQRPMYLVLAIIISLCGIAIGLCVSDIWYLNAKHLPAMLVRH